MIAVLRILFGAGLGGVLFLALRESNQNIAGDVTPGFYLAVGLILALANAIVWASWIGERIAGPLDSMYVGKGTPASPHLGLRLAQKAAARGHRRLAVFLAFIEGVRHPDFSGPFIVGMRNARPGGWLEKVFAREVYRFDGVDNCVRAYTILKQRGIKPPPHRNKEISGVLLSLEHQGKPPAAALPVPKAPEVELQRNPRIRLYTRKEPEDASGEPEPPKEG
ncbi:MAG: hypothetical protein KDM81_07865 [Verrucomicrobiae bacterium]|nr:hypothetical protein [Verrucomicrobiae bacterium]MCP5521175.1 hypothetical protein [Verrucomicrobiales bacterium]